MYTYIYEGKLSHRIDHTRIIMKQFILNTICGVLTNLFVS